MVVRYNNVINEYVLIYIIIICVIIVIRDGIIVYNGYSILE